MASQDILQHFHRDEHDFVDKMEDLISRVEMSYTPLVTDFLNPRQLTIVKQLASATNLLYYDSNSAYTFEYGRAIIAPDYYQFDKEDFELSLLEIRYNPKFNQLTHSQILGSCLHQLGIERHLIGDIIVGKGQAQVFMTKLVAEQALSTITKIARAGVSLQKIPLEERLIPKQTTKEMLIQVSSLRLDKLIAATFKLSRLQAGQLIEKSKVKLNYSPVAKTSEQVSVGDLISVRGFGRFKIAASQGYTKSNREKLRIERYQDH
ncbi:RNA-binding protein [Streptococcus sp. zg-JUN1979]|uniref:YlmH family RNA-binding protein n=1 Tax=Streptococcus sp. zg-JUN1979 TaxID=3391450 RepID=UPI0039A46BF8